MLTVFGVPKPFAGHIGVIQRNAIVSWTRLQPRCQVILCGDEPGTRETAAALHLEHIADVDRNAYGTPLLSSVFALVEERAEFELVCYANADIVLLSDIVEAARRIRELKRRFLMVGTSWDIDVEREFPSDDPRFEMELRARVSAAGVERPASAIDYFLYPKGVLGPLPPFAVGRSSWDNWMIYQARRLRIPVVDASGVALAVHQNHGYGHVPEATGSKWQGPESEDNRALLGAIERESFSLTDATHRLTSRGLERAVSAEHVKSRLRTDLLLVPALMPVYRGLRRLRRVLAGR